MGGSWGTRVGNTLREAESKEHPRGQALPRPVGEEASFARQQ